MLMRLCNNVLKVSRKQIVKFVVISSVVIIVVNLFNYHKTYSHISEKRFLLDKRLKEIVKTYKSSIQIGESKKLKLGFINKLNKVSHNFPELFMCEGKDDEVFHVGSYCIRKKTLKNLLSIPSDQSNLFYITESKKGLSLKLHNSYVTLYFIENNINFFISIALLLLAIIAISLFQEKAKTDLEYQKKQLLKKIGEYKEVLGVNKETLHKILSGTVEKQEVDVYEIVKDSLSVLHKDLEERKIRLSLLGKKTSFLVKLPYSELFTLITNIIYKSIYSSKIKGEILINLSTDHESNIHLVCEDKGYFYSEYKSISKPKFYRLNKAMLQDLADQLNITYSRTEGGNSNITEFVILKDSETESYNGNVIKIK